MARAASPRMVKDIVEGKAVKTKAAKTKAVLLKGCGVIDEPQQSGLTIIVGGTGNDVKVGIVLNAGETVLTSPAHE